VRNQPPEINIMPVNYCLACSDCGKPESEVLPLEYFATASIGMMLCAACVDARYAEAAKERAEWAAREAAPLPMW
jgi:hypothetical protein